MIELANDALKFSFPEVHPEAKLTIQFLRTLRIPDNDKTYPLPPGLGAFPIRHVDDYVNRVPEKWMEHGGVMMPMYQAEALWLHFRCNYVPDRAAQYPFAIKVAAGKIDAVTGRSFSNGLHREPQDYLVAPRQPWLDGFCVAKGTIRQFVAMPLGKGYTAEEQVTDEAEHGGLQLLVCPMAREAFDERFPVRPQQPRPAGRFRGMMKMKKARNSLEMGLAPGGKMRQQIYKDEYRLEEWDTNHRSRCFVHILNSEWWRAVTGHRPPHSPPSAKQYVQAGLPWFEYYDDAAYSLEGATVLAGLKSIAAKANENAIFAENVSINDEQIVSLSPAQINGQVREGKF